VRFCGNVVGAVLMQWGCVHYQHCVQCLYQKLYREIPRYTGVHSAMVDEDDEDPTQNPVVIWLQKHVPFVAVYDAKGSFFVQVPVDADGHAILPGVSHASSPRALPSRSSLFGNWEASRSLVGFGSLSEVFRKFFGISSSIFILESSARLHFELSEKRP